MQTTSFCHHILLTGHSTHDNPRKSKTKCIAFLKKKRNLKKLELDEKKFALCKFGEASWNNFVIVPEQKCIKKTLTDVLDDIGQDVLEKHVQYIAKNNELTQEIKHTHLQKSWQIIYSTHIFTVHLCGTYFPQPSKNSRKPGTRIIG